MSNAGEVAHRVPTLPLRADVLLSNTLFEELDNRISEEFLRRHLGTDNLDEADFLEIQVDSVREEGIECIGDLLPSLTQLRLNQSNIGSVRDLGTSLRNLRVLWLCRSSVQDLGGISVLPQLEELYVAFNDISDLMPLSTHESLQVLDLEGNLVEDFEEVMSLEHVMTLRELNLTMNPVWKSDQATRQKVFEALPQLEILDDLPRTTATDELDDLSDDDDIDETCLPEFVEASELFAEAALPLQSGLDTVPEDHYQTSAAVLALKRRAESRPGTAAAAADGSNTPSPVKEAWGFAQEAAGGAVERDVASPARRPSTQQKAFESPSSSPEEAHWSSSCSEAVAELRARLQQEPWGTEHGGRPPSSYSEHRAQASIDEMATAPSETKEKATEEPSEQDLILEGLKRAPKQAFVHSWKSSSARPASRWSGRHAMSSVASSASTIYRPGTSGGLSALDSSRSTLLSSASVADFDGTSSELTGGDDGSALVGTPLAAIRRRRQISRAQGEEDMNIRSLMKRFDFIRDQFHRGELLEEHEQREAAAASPKPVADSFRPGTPDVRVSPARLLQKGSGVLKPKSRGGNNDIGSRPRTGHRDGGFDIGETFKTSSFMRTDTGTEILSLEPIELS
eukprot:TRINITY_DN4068_c0_g1_i1.p1 TRINITY_DN4068_c0_g1~~TRINITY_DN4068_c0_g1_i1.p1  ORF type:complete len:625 (-),score=106.71 TRINITY_DN4068_c0_g1_i1:200-2074(-)